MKTALFLTDYDLSTVHYLCSYYKDNANLDAQDVEYIVDKSVEYQDSEILNEWDDLIDVHNLLEEINGN